MIYKDITQKIGDTPLVELNKITEGLTGNFYAKVEAFNPGNSVKDRIAKYIIEKAEKEGLLKEGSTVVETTSGNTGFAVAMLCKVKGYKCILAVSSKTTMGKVKFLTSLGAKVYICPANVPADHPDSYYETARRIAEKTPNSIYINQYFNKENINAHYNSTGPEIWKQTNGELTHFVCCSGTGGTISGIGRYLKEQNSNIKVLGIDAYGSVLKKYHETGELDSKEIYPYKIEGLGKNLIPTATDFSVIDEFVKVKDKESALSARELATKEALFCGYTSGAVIEGLKLYNKKGYFTKDSKVVVLFPDHGSRYMDKIYSDKWMKEQGFLDENHQDDSIVMV